MSYFRFDAGPSLFTMPQYVDELFCLAGKNPQDYFQHEKLDTICNYFYEDGNLIHAFADPLKFSEEIAEKTNGSTDFVLDFLNKSRDIYEITNPVFLQYMFISVPKAILKMLRKVPKTGLLRSMFLRIPARIGMN